VISKVKLSFSACQNLEFRELHYYIVVMKNSPNFSLAPVFVLSALCSACVSVQPTLNLPPETPRSQFSELRFGSTIPLYPERPANSSGLELTLNLTGMNSPAAQAEFFHRNLYSGDSLGAYRNRVVNEQTEIYRRTLAALDTAETEDRSDLNWYYTEEVAVIGAENSGAENSGAGNNGIVVERMLDTYIGGAHGLATKKYHVLDLESLKVVTINDLFEDFHDTRIRAIVYDALRDYGKLAKAQPLSEGGFFSDAPELTENFYVTEQGLGLYWNRYEIAPYVMGPIDIVIPWRDIRPRMLHSGMELMTKFGIYLFM